MLSTNQFGFGKGKSTTEAVVRLVDMIVKNIGDRKHTQECSLIYYLKLLTRRSHNFIAKIGTTQYPRSTTAELK